MGSSDSVVKFDKVDKSYDGETLVVKDLNVDIPKGEFLTMLGPCLLYTSPSPRDVEESRMPSSA